MFKKLLSVFLCVVIVFNFAPVVLAENDYSVEQIYLHNGLEKQSFSVIKVNDELYATADEISKIFKGYTDGDGTERFTVKENDYTLVFKIGEKVVQFSKENKKITVSPVNFSQSYSGTIKHDGAYYYPLSEALPWMNVECNIDNGVFVVKPDAKSLWEVSENIIFNSGLTFNFIEAVGDGPKVTANLILAHVFDGLMNLSAERLIANHKTGETIDSYNDYYDCFIEMATDDFLESDAAMAVFKDMKTINKIAGTTEELFFGGDADAKVSKFLEDLQVDGDTWLAYADVSNKLTDAANFVKTGAALSDWVKSLKVMEIATKTTVSYLDALKCQATSESNTSFHVLAANKALLALEDKGNAAIVSIADATKKAVIGEVLDVGNLLGGVGIILDAVDITLSLVWPINEKASEVTKLLIYDPIQNSALASAKAYKTTASSAEDIYLARVNYMLALLASKQSYEVILSFADNKDEINDDIEKINKVLTELAVCEASEKNDVICDKSKEAAKIKETLKSTTKPAETKLQTNYDKYGKYIGKDTAFVLKDYPNAQKQTDEFLARDELKITESVRLVYEYGKDKIEYYECDATDLYPNINSTKQRMTQTEFEDYLGVSTHFSVGEPNSDCLSTLSFSQQGYTVYVTCKDDGSVIFDEAVFDVMKSTEPETQEATTDYDKYGKYLSKGMEFALEDFPNANITSFEGGGIDTQAIRISETISLVYNGNVCDAYFCTAADLYPGIFSAKTSVTKSDFENYLGVSIFSGINGDDGGFLWGYSHEEYYFTAYCEEEGVIFDNTVFSVGKPH
ncbi:MAG: hypothetical protein J6Q83_03740 [Clostridia bacterium]|nr:hypothetical protein [Clostridia bacterium]